LMGLAAGSSAECVDALLTEIKGRGLDLQIRVAHWLSEPLPADLRELLIKAGSPGQVDVRQISMAHRALGEFFAAVASHLADRASVSWQKILCAGCFTYPIWHDGDHRFASTLTVGAPAVLAERTGVAVISEYAWRDLASGGQGGPLTPLSDAVLFRDPTEHRLLIHLGAMAHIVFLPAGNSDQELSAWQAGPGTALLDSLVQYLTGGKERVDAGGKYAVQGRLIPELFERWTNHPFLRRKPPKLAQRSNFAEEFARNTIVLAQQKNWQPFDLLCTANHLVAWALAESVRRWLPSLPQVQRLLLSGAGVRNGLIWRLLEEHFPGIPMSRIDSLGVPAEGKEALDAALLASFTLDAVAANIPSITGATGARVLGNITPGSASNWSRCLRWMAGQEEELLDEDD
jgi:anhydro-N-acetylmuramic acid kinase